MEEKKERSRLWLPVDVSSDVRRKVEGKGTKAFSQGGAGELLRYTEKNLRAFEKLAKQQAAKRKEGKPEAWVEKELSFWIERTRKLRKELATPAPFYIKPITKEQRRIRELLVKAGVPIEQPIQDLGRGLELFERGEWKEIPPLAEEGSREQIRQMVAKMLSLGVAHNHLHLGNFVMNSKKEVKLIDLSLARRYSRKPASKAEFLNKYSRDLYFASRSLAWLKWRYSLPSQNDLLHENIMAETKALLGHPEFKLKSFGVTAEEIQNAHIENERKRRVQSENW